MSQETLESLWAFCTQDGRLVPMPPQWAQLYERLRNTRQRPTGGREPALPLILAAWHHSSDREKRERLREHLEWAEQQGQLAEIGEFLRALGDPEWCRVGGD